MPSDYLITLALIKDHLYNSLFFIMMIWVTWEKSAMEHLKAYESALG